MSDVSDMSDLRVTGEQAVTSRERLLCAIRGDAPDRVPVAPFGLGALDPESDLCRELIERTDPFIPVWMGDAFMSADAVVVETRDGKTTTRVLETPRGPLTERIVRGDRAVWKAEHFCKSPEDVEAFLSLPFEPAAPLLDAYFAAVKKYGEEALVLADFENAMMLPARLFSEQDMCLMWAKTPDVVEALVREGQRRVEIFVDSACQAGVGACRVLGGEYVTVLLGPQAFDRLVAPFDAPLVELVHRRNGIVYYHNHGPIMRWLDKLARLGIDALDPLEAPPWGDADLRRAQEILGGRVCIVGNLDDMEVLDKLPTEDVLKMAAQRLRDADRVHFILGGTASGAYGERAARNFIAMAEMVRRDA